MFIVKGTTFFYRRGRLPRVPALQEEVEHIKDVKDYLDLDKVYKKRTQKIKKQISRRQYNSNDFLESKFRGKPKSVRKSTNLVNQQKDPKQQLKR